MLLPERYKLSALLPYPSFRAWWNEPHRSKSEEEKRFDRMRWRWFGLAIAGSIGYLFIWGPKLRLVKVADEDGEESLAIVVRSHRVDLDDDEEEDDLDDGGDSD